MKILSFIITLLVAFPVFGQSRVYTNADLGRPLSRTSTITAAEAAAILAPYQFVYVAPHRFEPQIVEIYSSGSPTAGPFGEFKEFSPARRLDGSLWTDPPWSTTTYVGRHRYSARDSVRGTHAGAHVLPTKDQLGSMAFGSPTRTIRSPQPERRATPATAAGRVLRRMEK